MESPRGTSSRLAHRLGLGLLLVGGVAAGCDAGTIGGPGEESDESDITASDDDGASSSGEGGSGTGATSGSGATGTGGATTSGSTSGTGGTGGGTTTSTGTGDGTTSATSTGSGPSGPMCGDGTCDADETCESCASDCGACDACSGASDATTTLDAEEEAFLVLINDYRAENGLGPLTACTSLNRAAQGHSEDMRDQDYFSHTGLDGSSPWERACDACYEQGCGGGGMAENIAAGNSGAAGTFEQWRTSPGHDANMLGGFSQIGIGRASGGGTYGTYWTNVFGSSAEPSCN